jgi:hypothetical protein
MLLNQYFLAEQDVDCFQYIESDDLMFQYIDVHGEQAKVMHSQFCREKPQVYTSGPL